jgi:hypothetical protein
MPQRAACAFQWSHHASDASHIRPRAFIGIATPGPTVLLALTNGSRYGVRASVDGMIGAVLSDFVLVSAVALGLGALLATSEFWFSAVKWVGVAYLAYLGMRLLRSKGTIEIAAGTPIDKRAPSRSTACTFRVIGTVSSPSLTGSLPHLDVHTVLPGTPSSASDRSF